MNKPKAITASFKAAALVGAFSLIAATAAKASFASLPSPTPELTTTPPGPVAIPTDSGTNAAGTVVAFTDAPFADPTLPASLNGTLRSIVVKETGGTYDFYYQLVNSSGVATDPLDSDIYRLNIEQGTNSGFKGITTSVAQVGNLSNLLAGTSGINLASYAQSGLTNAATADRGNDTPPNSDSIGFDFPTQPPTPFVNNLGDLHAGETSSFLVIKTNSTSYGSAVADVAGGFTGTGLSTFAAVPEPSSILFGLAMFGVALNGRSKRNAGKIA